MALEPSQLLLPGAQISLYTLSEDSRKDKCCHYWTFPGRIRLASGYHKVLLTADSGGAEGSPRRATGTMGEAPLGAQKQFLGSEHRFVTAGPQSSRRERTRPHLHACLHPDALHITRPWHALHHNSNGRLSPLRHWRGVHTLSSPPGTLMWIMKWWCSW